MMTSSNDASLGSTNTCTSLSAIYNDRSLMLLSILLLGSLALNVTLGLMIKIANVSDVRPAGVPEGTTLSPIPVVDRSGQRTVVDFESPTVLLALSQYCAWCEVNADNVRALASGASGEFRFVGVSLFADGLEEYRVEENYPFDLYLIEARDWAIDLGLGATPQTIVIRPGGQVERVWAGAADGPIRSEMEEFFDVTLPGISEDVSVVARVE